ncbi:hypothetical protein, partial [Helicobacter pylori]|uniref:hypothetical protein n=1 Tax=Helicobacter pylori TaxID=210 RepID=UPI0036F29ACA
MKKKKTLKQKTPYFKTQKPKQEKFFIMQNPFLITIPQPQEPGKNLLSRLFLKKKKKKKKN